MAPPSTFGSSGPPPRPVSIGRRAFLRGAGIAAGVGLVSGCSAGGSPNPSQTGGHAPGGATVRVWTPIAGPDDEAFQRRMLEQFMSDNPDIEVELQAFPPAQYGNAMQLAFTGGKDAPDVFRVGPGVQFNQAVPKEWAASIEEFITDEFRGRFPDWLFDPARSPLYRGGEAYAVPRADPSIGALRPMYCNLDLLADAGLDGPPTTRSQFRETVEKITADGEGTAYGAAIQGTAPSHLIMQALAGPMPYRDYPWALINLQTGQPAMSEPSLVDTVAFWQDLHREELLTPGWETWEAAQVFQQMATGRLGMIFGPTYWAGQLREANPDLNLAIAAPPIPDTGRTGSIAPNGAAPSWMMSTTARSREAAWRVLDFFGSADFQQPYFTEVGQISIMPAAYEGIEIDPDTKALRQMSEELVRMRPDPTLAHDDVDMFYADLIAAGPNPEPLDAYFEAITRGTDFAEVAARYDADLAAAFEATLAEYPNVTADMFTFPDWDPLEDFEP